MPIASILVFVLVFGATMAYVGWPLVHPLLAEEEPSARERRRAELAEEKERLLAALRDLEHDHRTGKLDDADHEALALGLKVRAAEVLREIDLNEGRRAAKPGEPAASAPPPAAPEPARADEVRFCTKCGRPALAADDRFCGRCGASLPAGG